MRMKRFLVFVSLMVCAVVANAQQEILELARADIRTGRMGMVAAAMELTPAQQEIFWPLYRAYADEQDALLERRMSMLKEFSVNYESMTDATAKSIAAQSFEIARARVQRRETWFEKFSKALGPVLAARFIQVDGQVSTLLDFELMKATPLIVPAMEETPPQ
jgi:hypothetical protein